jgi:hypothetical protein
MPRHDRAYGYHHQSGRKGGSTRRAHSTKPNPYKAKRLRGGSSIWTDPDHAELCEQLTSMGRHGGTSKGGSTPQAPKPQPKGGSKPGGTIRREVRRARSAP